MANEHMSELRELDVASLIGALAEAKDNAFKLRFQNATGQLEKTSSLGEARKQIARIATELRAREIAAAEGGVAVVAAPAKAAKTAKAAKVAKSAAKKPVTKKAAAKPAGAEKKAK